MSNRFFIPQDGNVTPIESAMDAGSIKKLMGTGQVMFIHLKNDMMLGVNYSSEVSYTPSNVNAVATEIYRKHIKDGIVYGPCVLVPKADFPEAA